MSDAAPAPVRRRLVCYLSGFDPQGPAHYHQMYSSEAALQAPVSGYRLEVGKRRKFSEHVAGWSVAHEADGQRTDTRYEFLRWDDIVREHWPRSRWGLFKATAFASWAMWRNGVMWHTWRRSWPMFAAIGLPGFLMVLVLALGLGLVAGALALAGQGHGGLALALLGVGSPALVAGARVAEARSHMAWLMRSLACLVRQGRGQTPSLDERLTHFAQHVADAHASGEFDELLVVGHSSGAMMAQIVVARALRRIESAPGSATVLSLLTLGHCSPLLSHQPEAAGFREELTRLAEARQLHWLDFGAPPDGCCFPLVDSTEGLALSATARRPKLLNPRFAQLFGAERYRSIRADKFRCHFQYLMATERTGAYDFFAITAGSQTLAARFAAEPGVTGFVQFTCFGGPSR